MINFVQIVRRAFSGKQLVMFPFGGGSGYSFMPIINELPPDIEVIVINPPGHLMIDGEPLESIAEMIRLYVPLLTPLLKENVLFFGHSIGGLVAYETARALRPGFNVKRMIVSSVNPPHCPSDGVDLRSHMSTEQLIDLSTKLGGLPEIFKSEPTMLEGFMKGLRGDLKALEHYTANPPDQPEKLDIEGAMLYSDSDYIVSLNKLHGWRQYIDCKEFIPFSGHHFYLLDETNIKVVAKIINRYAS